MKSRIFPHGNREKTKDYIRNFSATAQSSFIRLILLVATIMDLKPVLVDNKGSYLHSGPINDTYMFDHRET